MPKSKRNKQISLTRTHKNALELKKNLVEKVRSCVDDYANIFVFSVHDMRNSKLKDVREQWRHSRFLFGKNKVMALALGRTPDEEYRPNLHKISNRLRGQCGLLFSNKTEEEVQKWFNEYAEPDFARSGNTATCDVVLKEGPAPQFHFSLEPYLRQLGMPTELKRGIVHLLKDFQVCNAGDVLTPERAKILELIDHKMAEFKITIESFWSSSGKFTELKESTQEDEDAMENDMDVDEVKKLVFKTPKTNGISKSKSASNQVDVDEMDMQEENEEEIDCTTQGDIKNNNESDDNLSEDDDDISENEDDEDASENKDNGAVSETKDEVASETKDEIASETKDDENASENKEDEAASVNKAGEAASVSKAASKSKDAEKPNENVEPSPFKEPQSVPKNRRKRKSLVESSPDDKSPVFRSLRNRTVKIKRKK